MAEQRPTDNTIALAAFLLGRSWMYADELGYALKRLGFDLPSSLWISARLTAMTKESAPRFERRDRFATGIFEYRVTSWAATGLENTWNGFNRTLSSSASLPRPFPKAEPTTNPGKDGQR